jgi:hypothetical protein
MNFARTGGGGSIPIPINLLLHAVASEATKPLAKAGSAAASIVGLWRPRERGVMYERTGGGLPRARRSHTRGGAPCQARGARPRRFVQENELGVRVRERG